MLLPQRPYIPIGPLRDALAYPASTASFTEAQLRDALTQVGLDAFADRLDDSDNWQMRLSGGEQQRLAVARALLAAPDWLFLDEATASLDEESEAELYRAIAKTLPKTTLVSIGHRSTLNAFHKRRIAFEPHEGAPATVATVATRRLDRSRRLGRRLRRRAGFALHQSRRKEKPAARRRALSGDLVEQSRDRRPGHGLDRLGDQRRAQAHDVRPIEIVDADERHVFRAPRLEVDQRTHHADAS